LSGGSVVWLAIIQISNPLLCFDWMFEAIVQFGNAETPPHSGAVTDEQGSRWPDAAPPLRAGALWLAGFVAHSSQTAAGMLVARASPASQIASSKIGIYF